MASRFLQIATTQSVRAAQLANHSHAGDDLPAPDVPFAGLTEREQAFIAARDSFYMASTSETGWPYVQHRGGPAGFLKVLTPTTIGFLDFRGNRQYISLGNTMANDRAALFLMDYPHRMRLKLYARIEAVSLDAEPKLAALLDLPGYRARPERAWRLHLEAFDWNCPQHITQRFSAAEIEVAMQPMHARLAALEAENRMLHERLASSARPDA
jgi:predicted pyridoxine 5'-phosphate oxidase superfamily flavin-nucleotide-binding protein